LVIGLSPPRAPGSALATRYVRHAVKFHPRLMVLLVPPDTCVPEGYEIVHEDRSLCKGGSFYIPGSTVGEGVAGEEGGDAPALRILVRTTHWQEFVADEDDQQWKKVKV